jgi:hypothetical protein
MTRTLGPAGTFGPARTPARAALVRIFVATAFAAAFVDIAFIDPIIRIDGTAPTVAPLMNS